jgi:DNA mismatch repair protein MutS
MQRNLSTDEQTIEDLGIFGRHNNNTIYAIYNRANTRGGAALLEEMFRHPLADADAINRRSSIIGHFAQLNMAFPYNVSLFDMMEKYLRDPGEGGKQGRQQAATGEKEIQNGVSAVIDFIHITKAFAGSPEIAAITAYHSERESILQLLQHPELEPVLREQGKGKLPYPAVMAYDSLFRGTQRARIEQLLRHVYLLDLYISVAAVAAARQFIFPRALPKAPATLTIEGLYHPSLNKPVNNSISMNAGQNMIFLTGANMAGKSTFLRALSTALYLAHMGFPVAARSMEFSVMDAIYTTINLPDNLGIGASHFYAEVLRVKKMALELKAGKACFILFDELFRGTNVKDAHEATVAVIKGFAGRRNSLFIVSSHIVEAGEDLEQVRNIGFRYLPTRMNGHTPEYTYKLETGITDDRHGMIIIRNEGILETLKNGKKSI